MKDIDIDDAPSQYLMGFHDGMVMVAKQTLKAFKGKKEPVELLYVLAVVPLMSKELKKDIEKAKRRENGTVPSKKRNKAG